MWHVHSHIRCSHVICLHPGSREGILTFSSACSIPVAIWVSVVIASYSAESSWSSRSMGSAVLTLSFLYRTLRVAMMDDRGR
jgi:hypothetical protein